MTVESATVQSGFLTAIQELGQSGSVDLIERLGAGFRNLAVNVDQSQLDPKACRAALAALASGAAGKSCNLTEKGISLAACSVPEAWLVPDPRPPLNSPAGSPLPGPLATSKFLWHALGSVGA